MNLMNIKPEFKSNSVKDVMESLSENYFFNLRFLEKRTIFLWDVVMDDTAKDIINRLLYLESEKQGEEIVFYINSPGGSVTAGLSIYDTMKMISSPVSTICIGHAASMGAILLSGGTKGRRFIWPHAEVMIHQPSLGGYIQDDVRNLEITAAQMKKIKDLSAKILADNCGHSFEKIMKDFDRDYWMNANEAVEYGIVDGVIEKIVI